MFCSAVLVGGSLLTKSTDVPPLSYDFINMVLKKKPSFINVFKARSASVNAELSTAGLLIRTFVF